MRKSFKHDLGKTSFPQKLSEEELLQLYKDLPNSKEKIILHHIRLGFSIVAQWEAKLPGNSDLFVSAMFEALVQGLDNIIAGAIEHHTIPNITGYLVKYINGTIEGVVRKELRYYKRNKNIKGNDKANLDQNPKEILEVLNSIIEDERERKIIFTILEGENPVAKYGIPKATVSRIRNNIAQRFKKKYYDL